MIRFHLLQVFSCFAVLFLISAPAAYSNPAPFEIKTVLTVDGKEVSNPTIRALPGQMASITQTEEIHRGTFIEVIANENHLPRHVHLKFQIEYQDKTTRLKFHPEMQVLLGQEAEIELVERDGKPVRLKVLVGRVSN